MITIHFYYIFAQFLYVTAHSRIIQEPCLILPKYLHPFLDTINFSYFGYHTFSISGPTHIDNFTHCSTDTFQLKFRQVHLTGQHGIIKESSD